MNRDWAPDQCLESVELKSLVMGDEPVIILDRRLIQWLIDTSPGLTPSSGEAQPQQQPAARPGGARQVSTPATAGQLETKTDVPKAGTHTDQRIC